MFGSKAVSTVAVVLSQGEEGKDKDASVPGLDVGSNEALVLPLPLLA